MNDLIAHLRYALRGLTRTPVLTAVAVLSIAIAMGANTTVFSLVNAVMFRPLDFPAPDRLVDLSETSETRLCAGCGVGTSWATYRDWRRDARSFMTMGAYGEAQVTVSGGGEAQRVPAGLITASLFPTLGTAPAIGRGLAAEDESPGAPAVVLLGEGIWRRRFGAAANVLGQTLRVDGVPHTVIGVMPPGFKFPESAEVWVPPGRLAGSVDRNDRSVGVVARLSDGATLAAAGAELGGISRRLAATYPEAHAEWTARVVPLHQDLSSDTGEPFLLLFGAVLCVLLIACANLAGLYLARMTARRREMAVRAALGAGRGRLMLIVVTECLFVALAGGALGLLLATWGVSAAGSAIAEPVPYWVRFSIDWRVVTFALVASVGAGLLFGIIPAFRAARPDLLTDLKDGSPGGTVERQRLSSLLVILELGFALALLAGAGLQLRTLLRVTRPPDAERAAGLLQAELPFVGARFHDPARITATVETILARLTRDPRVAAAASHTEFLAGFGAADAAIAVQGLATVPAGASPRFAFLVTPGYLALQGRRMLEGRDLTPADRAGTAGVVLVNRALAERLWPGQRALGRQLKLGPADANLPWLTVIGVVADPPAPSTGGGIRSEAWGALAQRPGASPTVQLTIRAPGDPLAFIPTLRREVAASDPELPVERPMTEAQALRQQFWQVRFLASLFGVFAVLALLLAAIGTYGLLAHLVEQRTREIGVRLALGADARRVTRMILARGARLGLGGIALGLVLSWALGRVLQGHLFGTSPIDPAVLGVVVVVLAAVTVLASLLPARRAARVAPLEALRMD